MIRVVSTDAAQRERVRLMHERERLGGASLSACVLTPKASPEAQLSTPDVPNNKQNTCAVIVAAGTGKRFGDPRGKQFVPLAGLPLISWSILAFDRAPSIGHIVVVYPKDKLDEMIEVIKGLVLRCDVTLVAGGATRQDSVFSALLSMPDGYELVAVHDGARPLVRNKTIEDTVAALKADDNLTGAIAAIRATDTLKLVEDSLIVATPDRTYYWNAQTPQVFRTKKLLAAHRASVWDDYVGTDDASLIERRGGKVICVTGARDNIKVTVPEDRIIAEALLEHRIDTEGCGLCDGSPSEGGLV